MASQSVTILHATAQANRTFRLAGTLTASNWADAATIYTVPTGKRLILKGAEDALTTVYGADQILLSGGAATGVALTLVLSAGTILKTSGTGQFIVSGFLEDDV